MPKPRAEILVESGSPNRTVDPIDKSGEPVLTLPQRQTLVNRVYGLRQSALSIAAQCEQIADYLRRNTV